MEKCPSQDCHDRVVGHHTTLYGQDGMGGLTGDMPKKAYKTCLKDYIKKPSAVILVCIISAIIIPLLITGIKVWSQQEVSPHIYTTKSESQIRETRVIILEQTNKKIACDIAEIKVVLKEQKAEMQNSISEIKRMLAISHRESK